MALQPFLHRDPTIPRGKFKKKEKKKPTTSIMLALVVYNKPNKACIKPQQCVLIQRDDVLEQEAVI